MSQTTTSTTSSPNFVVEPTKVELDGFGRQVDWANVHATNWGTSGERILPAGVVVALLASGMICPRIDQPGTEGAYGFLVDAAYEKPGPDAISGYGVITGRATILENHLPEADASGDLTMAVGAARTEVLALGFKLQKTADDRLT